MGVKKIDNVTPHTGVWIETLFNSSCFCFASVTPHTGVWIETNIQRKISDMIKSRPTRACGLKHTREEISTMYNGESRPTRACGLKHTEPQAARQGVRVTPHTGVWIETRASLLQPNFLSVTPHTGVWIETRLSRKISTGTQCHAPHGRVD